MHVRTACTCVALVAAVFLATVTASEGACEAVAVRACMHMPYTRAHMPNAFGHTSQSSAEQALQAVLLDFASNTVNQPLVSFLCSAYIPGCRQGGAGYLPPCRNSCQRARAVFEAAKQTTATRRRWPKQLRCNRFPRKRKSGLCHDWRAKDAEESRSASEATIQYYRDEEQPTNAITVEQPVCPERKYPQRIKRKDYFEKDFDYAVKATFLSAEGIVGGPLIATIHIGRVLKMSRVRISRANLTLWAQSGQICPQLKTGREYLILGYEDTRNKRLLFNADSMALPWRKTWARRITKWEARCSKRPSNSRGEPNLQNRKRKCMRKKGRKNLQTSTNNHRRQATRRQRRPSRLTQLS